MKRCDRCNRRIPKKEGRRVSHRGVKGLEFLCPGCYTGRTPQHSKALLEALNKYYH